MDIYTFSGLISPSRRKRLDSVSTAVINRTACRNGVFHQYREYNENHQVVLEIGYHNEPSLGKGDVLHVHVHTIPGVKGRDKARKFAIHPGDQYYEKYKKFFKGVK